jgi:hypothetical protein
VGLGSKRPSDSAMLEQANDEGGADAKESGNLTNRAFVIIDGGRDPLSKIQRIGAHGSDLPLSLDPYPWRDSPKAIIRACNPEVNRCRAQD